MDYHILDGLQILVLVPSECIWSFQCLFPRFRNLLLNRKTKKKRPKLGNARETPESGNNSVINLYFSRLICVGIEYKWKTRTESRRSRS